MEPIDEIRKEIADAELLAEMMNNSKGWQIALAEYEDNTKTLYDRWLRLGVSEEEERESKELRARQRALTIYFDSLKEKVASLPALRETLRLMEERNTRESGIGDDVEVPAELARLTNPDARTFGGVRDFLSRIPVYLGGDTAKKDKAPDTKSRA